MRTTRRLCATPHQLAACARASPDPCAVASSEEVLGAPGQGSAPRCCSSAEKDGQAARHTDTQNKNTTCTLTFSPITQSSVLSSEQRSTATDLKALCDDVRVLEICCLVDCNHCDLPLCIERGPWNRGDSLSIRPAHRTESSLSAHDPLYLENHEAL